jgi:hypothetical protein
MLVKSITYPDFNGEIRTEDFLFNLSQAECMEMELSTNGGMQQLIERIVSEKDSEKIVSIFKKLILKAYGIKSPDGKYFRKSDEISKDFESTNAYSVLFMELATNADAAAEFIRKVLPAADDVQMVVQPMK